jgi:hypothetical protein
MNAVEQVIAGTSDLTVETAFPGTAAWQEIADFEHEKWPQIFPEITPEEHLAMYGPFNARSVFNAVRRGRTLLGMSRVILPDPNTTQFEDAGLLSIQDAITPNPIWGQLDISPQGWQTLRTQYDPRLSVDFGTHFNVEPRNNAISTLIETMGVGIAHSHGLQHVQAAMDPQKRTNGAVIVTDLVGYYLRGMQIRYNHTSNDTAMIGVQPLGKAVAYGAPPNKKAQWVTMVAMPTKNMLAAYAANFSRPLLATELFNVACPNFAQQYHHLRQTLEATQ